MINNQTGGEGGQGGQERRRVDPLYDEQLKASVQAKSNPQEDMNTCLIITDEVNHQYPQAGPILKQPLRLKFKGVIVNRLLGNIFSTNQRQCLEDALHSLRNAKNRIRPLQSLSLDDLQRRTMIVLIKTTTFLIEQCKKKLIKQAFSALHQSLI